MFIVVEHRNRKRIVIATGFVTLAAAQNHIAHLDPAARRFLLVEEG